MRHRPRLVPVALAVAALVLAGCSGQDEGDTEPTAASSEPTSSPSAEETEEPSYWPLTGLERASGAPRHPVLVTKIDNTSSSAPQVGLGSADMVVEELVEGGMTRLAAFHYSKVLGNIGPVRSMRATDIGIVPDGATVVMSGAAQVTLNRVNAAGIPWVTEGDAGVYRDNTRSAPYNLFAHLTDIAKRTKAAGEPAPYLPWGTADDLPQGVKARTLTANFGNHSTSWEFRGGRYVNTNSYAAADDQFPASSVLVLRVRVGDAGYKDPAGYPVPETKFEGQGAALLFHDGRLVRGTWSKAGLKAPLELRTPKGDLPVPAGKVWIELVPALTGDVTWAK